MSDGSAVFICYPLSWGFLHCVSRSSLNMLCTAHFSGSSNWNTSCSISFVILKGLYFFWSDFFKGCFNWIFLASNHISFSCFSPWVLELWMIDSILFLFFYFILISFTLLYFTFNLGLGFSMTVKNCHMTWYSVKKIGHMSWSHNYISQKNVEDSRIIILYYMLMAYNIHAL